MNPRLLGFILAATAFVGATFAGEVYVAATDFTSFADADGNTATLGESDDIIIAERDGRLSLANCTGWTFDFRSTDYSPLMTFPAAAVLPESIAVTVLTESVKSFPTDWTTVADMSACSSAVGTATLSSTSSSKLAVRVTRDGCLQVRKVPGFVIIVK